MLGVIVKNIGLAYKYCLTVKFDDVLVKMAKHHCAYDYCHTSMIQSYNFML